MAVMGHRHWRGKQDPVYPAQGGGLGGDNFCRFCPRAQAIGSKIEHPALVAE